jgi:Ca2+-binding RTX toxin-like protein
MTLEAQLESRPGVRVVGSQQGRLLDNQGGGREMPLFTRLGVATVASFLVLVASAAALTIIGTPGDDQIVGSRADDQIRALAGNDRARALGGADLVRAGDGDDLVGGGPGADRMGGGPGDDEQRGGPGSDLILAGLGADQSFGGPGNDRLWGVIRDDVNTEGVDSLDGGGGNDRLHARDGEPDNILCGPGRDRAALDETDVIVDATKTSQNGSCEVVLRASPTGTETEPAP